MVGVSGGPQDDAMRMVAVNPRRLDWFRIIVDIERTGLHTRLLAPAVGCSRRQLRAYKDIPDTEPKFHVAMMLLGLWQERVNKPEGLPFMRW